MHLLDTFTSTSKINLFLDVIGRDSIDNYHYLESVFYEIDWGDEFQIFESYKDQIVFTGVESGNIPENNTVKQALNLFKEKYRITENFSLTIHKNVPIGAGVGGGSGDAGALIKWLSYRYQINPTDCLDIAQQIGSDIPFFLYGGVALVEGKGEKITPLAIQLKDMYLLIIYPNKSVSTKEAFDSLKISGLGLGLGEKRRNLLKKTYLSIDNINQILYNIFNENIEYFDKRLFDIRKQLLNVLKPDVILMTGSGSSFVLFYKGYDNLLYAEKSIEHTFTCSKYFIQSI